MPRKFNRFCFFVLLMHSDRTFTQFGPVVVEKGGLVIRLVSWLHKFNFETGILRATGVMTTPPSTPPKHESSRHSHHRVSTRHKFHKTTVSHSITCHYPHYSLSSSTNRFQ